MDVSVQAQILNLLNELQNNLGLAYPFITHNISVVEYFADEVAVMYLGRIVERGGVDEVLISPRHPYTQALISAMPVIELESKRQIIRLTEIFLHPLIRHPVVTFILVVPTSCQYAAKLSSNKYIQPNAYAHCYLYPQERSARISIHKHEENLDDGRSEVARRRTFAIISHPDAGKTTLTEKLLLFAGAIHIAGSVKARKASRHATSDWMEIEKQRGISVPVQ